MGRAFLQAILPLLIVLGFLGSHVSGKRLPSQVQVLDGASGGVSRKVLTALEKKYPLDLERLVLKGVVERQERHREAERTLAKRMDGLAQAHGGQGDVMLETAVQVMPSITIFSGYIRQLQGLSQQLADEKQSFLIFAPSDETISGLLVKPWEYPNNIAELEKAGASPAKIDEAIKENISRFVLSHIVSKLDFQTLRDGAEVLLRSDFYPMKSTGGDILLKKEGSDYLVASAKDGDFIKVSQVDTAANGIVMIIDTCLSFDYEDQ